MIVPFSGFLAMHLPGVEYILFLYQKPSQCQLTLKKIWKEALSGKKILSDPVLITKDWIRLL